MKLQERPRGQTDTGAETEQMYEEVGEELATGSRRGQHATMPASPHTHAQASQGTTQQLYDEVGVELTTNATPTQEKAVEGTMKPGTDQQEQPSHYD